MEQRFRSSPKRNKLNVVLGVIGIIIVTLVACWLLSEHAAPGKDTHLVMNMLLESFFVVTWIAIVVAKYPRQWFVVSLSVVMGFISTNHIYEKAGLDNTFPALSGLSQVWEIMIPIIGLGLIFGLALLLRRIKRYSIGDIVKRLTAIENKIKSIEIFGSHNPPCEKLTELEEKVKKTPNTRNGDRPSWGLLISVSAIIVLFLALIFVFVFINPNQYEINNNLNGWIGIFDLLSRFFLSAPGIMIISLMVFLICIWVNRDRSTLRGGIIVGLVILVAVFLNSKIEDQSLSEKFIEWFSEGNYIVPPLILVISIMLVIFTAHLIDIAFKVATARDDREYQPKTEYERGVVLLIKKFRNKCFEIISKIIEILTNTVLGLLKIVLFIPNFIVSLSGLVLGEEDEKDDEGNDDYSDVILKEITEYSHDE